MVLIGILLTFWGTKTIWAEFRQNSTHNVKHSNSWLPILLPRFGRKVFFTCESRSCGSSPLWAEKTSVVPMAIDATTAKLWLECNDIFFWGFEIAACMRFFQMFDHKGSKKILNSIVRILGEYAILQRCHSAVLDIHVFLQPIRIWVSLQQKKDSRAKFLSFLKKLVKKNYYYLSLAVGWLVHLCFELKNQMQNFQKIKNCHSKISFSISRMSGTLLKMECRKNDIFYFTIKMLTIKTYNGETNCKDDCYYDNR